MNHREVMQQVLEALEDLGMKHYENTGEVLHRDVYEAFRAALAEPQEPVAYWLHGTNLVELDRQEYHSGTEWTPLYTHPAPQRQSQDEPAAKVELMTTGGNAGLATRIVEIDDHLRERLRPGQMLYTHPAPQRQPLTDEQIRELSQQHKFDSRMEKFVRIIERAHGIGGQE